MPLFRSVLDTEYASWPIKAPVDITNDPAQVGFVPGRWDTPDTWHDAEIVVNAALYGDSTPRLRVLIGPANGGAALAKGTWYAIGKITDDPEVPVLYLDYIVVR